MKHACAWALPWKQLQQHSDVTNFTPPDIYWPTFETSAQIIQTRKAAVSTTLAESVPAAGNKLLRFWRTLVTHSGYAQKAMVCSGSFALTCRFALECGVLNFCAFSSRAGLRREGAPGGLRGCCGRRADSGTYGDISEWWVRGSVQILALMNASAKTHASSRTIGR